MVASFVFWGKPATWCAAVIGTSVWVAKVGGTTIEVPALETEYRRAGGDDVRGLLLGQEASAWR